MNNIIFLSIINWIHLLATVSWIGGMITNILILTSSAGETLEPPVMGKLMGAVMKRYRTLVYSCILLLVVNGDLISRINPGYEGFFQLTNP